MTLSLNPTMNSRRRYTRHLLLPAVLAILLLSGPVLDVRAEEETSVRVTDLSGVGVRS